MHAPFGKHLTVHFVVAPNPQAGRELGQTGASRLRRELEPIDGAVGSLRAENAFIERDLLDGHLEEMRREPCCLRDQVLGAQRDHRARVTHRPARMRAAACGDDVGVAECDRDLLERKPEQIGGDLRETRLVTLPRRLGSDDDLHAFRMDDEIGALLGRTGGGFHIVDEAQTEQLAAAAGILSALLDARPNRQACSRRSMLFSYSPLS